MAHGTHPIRLWIVSSLRRVTPADGPCGAAAVPLDAAPGERVSFQVCARNDSGEGRTVRLAAEENAILSGIVRTVGYVPVPVPGSSEAGEAGEGTAAAADPLFPRDTQAVPPGETRAFWVTVRIAPDAAPGVHRLSLGVEVDGRTAAPAAAALEVHPFRACRVPFPVTHWFYVDALCDWYGLDPWEDRLWTIIGSYMRNLADHGNTCQHVPVFTPPTDGVKRPTQLLRVRKEGGTYAFDFTDVLRFVRMADRAGMAFFEWCHLFTQWGADRAIRVYRDNADPDSLLWPAETAATSPEYRGFLAQFLPRFHRFLADENLLHRSFFHLSDEPGEQHLENYRAVRGMVRELAPWMKTMDALSHVEFAREGLVDMPVAIVSSARDFLERGIGHWTYFCCGPREPYLNRLIETPLETIRMSGWLFYRFGSRGFLHWGYNYWYRMGKRELIDPYMDAAAGASPRIPPGDPFVVYPGKEGPIDSIRWEVFADSMQDHALLECAGADRDGELLRPLEGYDRFPRDAEWVHSSRRKLLTTGGYS